LCGSIEERDVEGKEAIGWQITLGARGWREEFIF